jgi:antitoxin component YwqK of YwqJK toxin-antitoxin module
MITELLDTSIITYMERNMIQHEITIYQFIYFRHYLGTWNRDLKRHREGDLPAYRGWYKNGNLWEESYRLNGLAHREGDLPAWRDWHENGNLGYESYYLNGKKHREGDLPADRSWYENGTLGQEEFWLHGEEYDPT